LLLPHTWNNGMAEAWNVDFNKKFKLLLILIAPMTRRISATAYFPISPEPIIPSFQYSNIPNAE
jgi:hypothetical protein